MPTGKRSSGAGRRESKAIAAVACSTCGAERGELCRRGDGTSRIQDGRPMICSERRSAWQLVRDGQIADAPRITQDPAVMGGKPCIRGMRITVATIVGLIAAGRTADEILRAYPSLDADDLLAAVAYTAKEGR